MNEIDISTEIIFAIAPYVRSKDISDIQMKLSMILNKYSISKANTEITVYQGDANEEIIKRYIMAKTAAGRSRRTLKYYKETLTIIFSAIGKTYTDITAEDIRYYLAIRINRDKISKTTANNERRNLSAFYAWLRKEEILLKNPMSKVENIKQTKEKKKAFTDMDVEKIRYACRDTREKALIEILLSTWARVSEVAEMKISDICENKITVHGKGDKYRDTFLNAKAQIAIKAYLSERNDSSDYLFAHGKSIKEWPDHFKKSPKQDNHLWWQQSDLVAPGMMDTSSLESIVRNIGVRAGVQNCHPHRFRRTGATMALNAGMPLIEVSKLLGHENIGTTQIYLDITDADMAQAHKKYVV